MNPHRFLKIAFTVIAGAALVGCAHQPAPPFDYTAFKASKPATVLVLPPINDSPEVKATPAVWAQATRPLSEAGYYVLPVALVNETFRQNGVDTAVDAQAVSYPKLREVFGADAAVFIKVTNYGTKFAVLASETTVTAEARIVDLRSGAQLWSGKASASSAEQAQQQGGGLAGMLVAAVVKQVIGTVSDVAFDYAGIADDRLLGAPRFNGVLPGPRARPVTP